MRRSDPRSIAPVQVLSNGFDELADIQAECNALPQSSSRIPILH
jgi:hypothetical protein